ncbi:type VI secretion system lipoprotein TssJ [Pseudomonas sp. N3-W]|uniref:Type VI secretion system lipoprotein TssJ n=1 Tax=Pseudomonas fungipugnans TaxID=3024217 RepID=A0ABT6QPG8_9PSED|nr:MULTISPECIES: type VI secretion system lipoprotein TssJ [unclassified Pseudomonas]MDI2592794.1 type VI secretion system lipoprotein TssJ [Pseudomonas sp. 681]UWF49248.1 type VI secretion system lipoprotein TssJ [Pseudomonas sp. N3-W]
MSRRSTVFLKMLTALTALVLMAGCSTISPYSHVTKVNLKLTASDQLNPDLNGRPSPIVVRLFELKHPVAFENADFFSLYERAKESLAPDMVASEELELRPGETVELKLSVEEGSRYIGVLAAYRDLPESKWRYTVQVTPVEVTDADLTLDQSGIRNTHESLAKADD